MIAEQTTGTDDQSRPGQAPSVRPGRQVVDAASRHRARSFARLARLGQIILGAIWLIDGILQFQPYMFGKTFITGVILPNAQGQPGIIAEPIRWIAHLIEPHVGVFNGFAATLQVLIGLGLMYRRTVKPALLISFAWAAGIWLTGEGLGGFFNNTASPLTGAPSAVLLYVIAGLMVWPSGKLRGLGVRGEQLGLLGVRGARAVLATLWGGFALLWLLPANISSSSIHDALQDTPTGVAWLTSLVNHVASASAGRGTPIAVCLAVISGAIAVAIASGWHARVFLAVSMLVALVFWVLGQGFGGVFTGQATDVNTGPLLILLAALTWCGISIRTRTQQPAQGGNAALVVCRPAQAGRARTGTADPRVSRCG